MHTLTIVTIEFAATAHLMMSLVMFRFARRSVNYLSQAWIMLLICLMYCGALFFVFTREIPSLGFLHPALLIYLLACSYLQSIYPLGLCMPGYLQWGRMWKYAAPALALIFIYILGALLGSGFARVYELSDVGQYLLSGDILLRFAALGLSGYYIANIFLLPHRLMRRFELPRDLIAYGTALGIVSLYFVILTLNFNLIGLTIYILFFTVVVVKVQAVNRSWLQGILDKDRWVRAVFDDIDVFAAQLVDDCLNPGASWTNTSTNRIDVRVF